MAPVRGKWLACKPCTEVPWSVDGPFGDLRRDAKPPGQFSVGEEPQRRSEQSGKARREVVFDVQVGRQVRIDRIAARLEIENHQGTPADGAEYRPGVFAL